MKKTKSIINNAVADLYSFTREVFYDHMVKQYTKIGGPLTVVEIDEAKFGKRKFNRGLRVKGQWVFGGVERNSNKSFLVPVESRDSTPYLNSFESGYCLEQLS